jgi:hypothetical protein
MDDSIPEECHDKRDDTDDGNGGCYGDLWHVAVDTDGSN